MKRLLTLLFIIALSFTLWSCGDTTCTEHVDSDSDLLCDECGAAVPCTEHTDTKTDGVYKCDKCGIAIKCSKHEDEDGNLKCDECSAKLECKSHVDKNNNGECDKCFEFIPCKNHTDKDGDYGCDRCSEEIDCEKHTDTNEDNQCDSCSSAISCLKHKDDDENLRCDRCGTVLECTEHKDTDGNLKCDKCKATLECTEHKDDDRDLVCDRCAGTVECTHLDENNDSICDVEKCKWNYDHTHSYDSVWTTDENKHWHKATCGHNVPPADEAAHSDEDNNGICDKCAYIMCKHLEFNEEGWCEGDKDGHWRPLKCGHNVKPDADKIFPHSFNADERCETCGYQKEHIHTFEEAWSTTETEHYHKSNCDHETVDSDRGSHIDVDAYDGICDTCGYIMCSHETFEEWHYNATSHWREPKCDHISFANEGEHADTNNDGLCDVCSWDYDHKHTDRWLIENDGHTRVLTCGHQIEGIVKEEHVDSDNDRLCDVCEYGYEHEHIFSDAWTSDETHHWHICTDSECAENYKGAKANYEKHTDGYTDFRCDVCNKEYEEVTPSLPDSEDEVLETPKYEIK